MLLSFGRTSKPVAPMHNNSNKSLARRGVALMVLAALLSACKQPLERVTLDSPAFDTETLVQLRQTTPTNLEATLTERGMWSGGDRLIVNPYTPPMPMSLDACQQDPNCSYALARFWSPSPRFPAQGRVYDWWTQRSTAPEQAAVCGVRFDDDTRTGYALQTFPNHAALLQAEGYHLTHYQACGACSTLSDLAIYGELDLTRMAKTCSKRLSFSEKFECMKEIGFTPACAESWAYNATKTGQSCALICVAEYGLIPLLTGTENKPPVDENGELNACLMCDEMMAGPGFQFSAGRTRRNSGIISEIDRPDDQVYSVSHGYFQD